MQVKRNAVRRLRNELRNMAREGRLKTRIVGERGNYEIAVQRGEKLIVVSPPFANKTEASLWNVRKTLREVSSRVVKV